MPGTIFHCEGSPGVTMGGFMPIARCFYSVVARSPAEALAKSKGWIATARRAPFVMTMCKSCGWSVLDESMQILPRDFRPLLSRRGMVNRRSLYSAIFRLVRILVLRFV